MKYLIIGLGNFGRTLAEELTDNDNEVIGIDNDEMKTARWNDVAIATSLQILIHQVS